MALLQSQFQLEYTYLEIQNARTLGETVYHYPMSPVLREMR